ncbi:TPA: hypothetical protein EYO12_02835 [Candidatus Saccharibacteria bacterium]|nr:hypothetical protein [Candidatus Saccharibacteria bacterium]HIO88025.1 hypothetical protein [Candidatus Saccharibacteria bacterium]
MNDELYWSPYARYASDLRNAKTIEEVNEAYNNAVDESVRELDMAQWQKVLGELGEILISKYEALERH